MSWLFSAVGKPDAVKRAIEESSNNKYTGPSLDEWNEAKPALLALVGANVGNIAVRVNASGHATFETRPVAFDEDTRSRQEGTVTATERVKTQGQCSCVIESIYGFVE